MNSSKYQNTYLASESETDTDSESENKNNFDFNINNYTIRELQNFLGLYDNFTYNDVVEKHKNMHNIIKKSKDNNSTYKNNIIYFIEKAKQILIETIKTSQNEQDLMKDSYELLNTNDKSKLVIPFS